MDRAGKEGPPAATIDRIRADLEAERSTEGFAKRKEADARRRDKAQAEYVEDFLGAVVKFLAFHGNYADLADKLARAVSRSEAAPSPGQNASRSSNEPRPLSSLGCGTVQRPTIRCQFPGSEVSAERFDECLPGDPTNCWTAIGGRSSAGRMPAPEGVSSQDRMKGCEVLTTGLGSLNKCQQKSSPSTERRS